MAERRFRVNNEGLRSFSLPVEMECEDDCTFLNTLLEVLDF